MTRSPLWLRQLDLLVNENVTVGMSVPYLDDELSRAIEPNAPPPMKRYEALKKAHEAGCRLYVAVAPTPPMMGEDDFKRHLERLLECDPEVIFWEPINARGTNGTRMKLAGLDFVDSIMTRERWAQNYLRQWEAVTNAATLLGCADRLHIWVDAALKGYVSDERLAYWMSRPTVEKWG
ncbi:MAG: hypothetical protein N5P05_004199 (plasmid) [Chroococcopsis gigantea SAG 12.99]|nr:hypothetical protein [Chroococcopsis gigantea SAG 12.99]